MKKKLKLVEVVEQFLAVWTPKNIQIKLIHKLGGYTEDELITAANNRVVQYSVYLKNHFISIEKEIYGKSKQEWIDTIHKEIQNII